MRRLAAAHPDWAEQEPGAQPFAHRAFANANTPIFENLTNLGTLPPQGAVFIGLPMKIGGGSGGPLRAVALLP